MANKNLNTRIVLRNDTKANWQSVNPVLMKGELGVEFNPSATSEGRKILFKIGDGVTAWNDLPYGGGDFAEVIAEMQRDIIQLQQALPIEEYDATNTVAAAINAVDVKATAAASAAAAAQITANSAASAAVAAQGRADEAYTLASQASAAAGSASEAIAALEAILPKDSFSASQTVAGALNALDGRIDALEGNHFVVVETLPATGQSNIIYLVPDANVGYKEWIYIKTGSNPDVYAWEEIGDTNIDLSNYYTKAESDARFAPISHNHDGVYAPYTHNHDDRYYTKNYVDQNILDETQDQSLAYRINALENAGYATATWVSNNFVGKTAYTQDQATIASHFNTIDQQLDPSQDQSLPSRITALENDLDVDEAGSLAARFAVVEGAYASKNYVDNNFVKNNDVLILDCGNASTNYSAS